MTITDFITNNPDLVTLVVGTVTGIIWKKGKLNQTENLWETLLLVGRQAFTKLLQDKRLYDDAYVREVISKTIWAGLTRLNVPKNSSTMKLVDEAVEHVHGELAEMVMAYHLGQLERPLKAAADKLDTFKPTPAIEPAADPATP